MRTMKELKRMFGLEKLTTAQTISMIWCATAFAMIICCDYENSAWYALPALVAHFAASAIVAIKIVPASAIKNICKED